MPARFGRVAVVAVALAVSAPPVPAAAVQEGARPRLVLADPAGACPAIEGAFVALLDPARGMLLLSGGEFLGGQPLAKAIGGALRVPTGATSAWTIPSVSAGAGPVTVWGAVYPFTGAGTSGCVAFDRERFSSEGDLVTYLRWLVDEVYLAIPAEERRLRPAFRIANREVRLRIQGLGFQPLPLAGREGAAQAFRLPGVERTYLLTPYVLDEATARVAVMIASTSQEFWQGAEKTPLGWIVAARDQPGAATEPPFTVVVEGVGSAPAAPAPAP